VRNVLLDLEGEGHTAVSDALLYNAARHHSVIEVIRPALERGDIVISDRYADSTLAYQGYGHGIDAKIFEQLYEVAAGGFRPDLTLILDLPIETGLRRAAERRGSETRYESLPRDFHARVRTGFLEIAAREPKRCIVIDATGTVDAIAGAIADAARDRLGA
jgi:dTMP kinase